MRRVVMRGNTANCPNCWRWHELFFFRTEKEQKKLILFCDAKGRARKVIMAFFPIPTSVKEYIPKKEERFVFIREGFKIIKETDYQKPKLFDS